MADEVTSRSKDNKMANRSTVETYTKRTGAAGAEGHFLEISLLTLCKLRGDQQQKDFYLAGNLESAGDFDDIVFRYRDDNDRENVIFLQSKFKQNPNHKITIKTFETDHDWPLQKYFESFVHIMDEFKKSGFNDPIFGGKKDNLNCHFVIYTNANRHDDMKEHVIEVENPLHFVLGETNGRAFKLKVDKAKNLLQEVQHDLEIEQVIKQLKQIHTAKCKNLDRDDNFKMYHAFFTQTVLVKDGRCWKYRNDFLDGNFQNKVLKKFRERTFSWYTEQMGATKSAHNNDNIIKHMKGLQLDLPHWFENAMSELNTKLCDEFIKIASQCISGNISTITKMSKKLMKEFSKFVGNVLVFDEDKAMFKLNEEHLDGGPREILEYLTDELIKCNIDPKLHFDIQVENLPRLSLGFTKNDSKNIEEFTNQLTIITGQPDVEGLKQLIQTNFGNVNEMEIASYHIIIGKMADWWKKLGQTEYLRKDDGFMDGVLSGIVFNVMDPLTSFTGRTEELEQLHTALQNKQDGSHFAVISQMASISGLGGIGKTQLARQYVHKYGHNYESIIWIDAETRESMGNCFRRLCKDCLKIPTQDANKMEMEMKSIVQEVYSFFQNRKSLFIFDNAQYFKNIGTLMDGVGNFLPTTKQTKTMARFLLTSRNQKWPNATPIDLNVLNDAEAEELVKSSLDIKDDRQDNDVKELTNELQNFPLALQQAVAHIRQKQEDYQKTRGTLFHIYDYLELYKDKTKEFLEFKFPDECEDQYTKTTFMTWNITLAEIEKSELGKKAREIFYIMAYLNPNDIPISFFSEIVDDREQLDQVFVLIHKYSMITLRNGMASIHRLVQSVTRLNLQHDGRMENRVLKKALSLVKTHTDHQLIAEGASVWNYANKDDDLVNEFKGIPAKLIQALREALRYEESYAFGKVSIESLQLKIGPAHEATLSAHTELAKTLLQQGHYKDALSTLKEVRDIQTKVFGPDHPDTLTIQHNIAYTLSQQDQYEDALGTYKEVLEIQTKVLGPNHPDNLLTLHNIADTLSEQGQYEDALSTYKEVLEKKTNVLGPNHPDTLTTQHNIAHTLFEQGQYEDALRTYKEVLEKRTKVLGPNHTHTLTTQHNIAHTLSKQGQHEDALSTYKEILGIQTKVFGPNHLHTLTTQHNIAQALSQQGQHEDALRSYKEVLEKGTKILGPNHPNILTTQHHIAQALFQQGQYEDALSTYKEVLEKRTKVLGPNHPDILTTQNHIAQALSQQGQHEDAFHTYQEVLEKKTKVLGPNHPDTLTTQHNVARTLYKQGRIEDALTTLKEVLHKATTVLGPNHPSTLTTQHNIAALQNLVKFKGLSL